jgi:glycoprotein-N-acetylgalactosamine 3-beta-galactosyltransferase
MTIAEHHDSHARHVKATWASHCDDYLFISSATNASLPAVDVNVSDGRAYLWTKTRAAFRHIYKWELSQYDWFLKADDDTYVIVENLRYMLRNYSYQQPIFFGCKFRKFIPEGTMSGGAGYVLSREAVRRLVDEALTPAHADRCIDGDGTGVEDLEISKCLAAVGVIAGDSRDHTGKHRMLPFNMQKVVIPEASETEQAAKVNNSRNQPDWWYEYTYYPFEQVNIFLFTTTSYLLFYRV